MSYSFTVKAADKAAAKAAVEVEFDKVVATQTIHARDRAAVLANASAVIDLLEDNPDKDITVSCNGSLSWGSPAEGEQVPLTGAGVGCNAYHYGRE